MPADHPALLDYLHRVTAPAAMQAVADADLLDRFTRHQDEAAFAALVRRHGPMVLGVCRRALANSADAEDAFQATFLVLAQRARVVRRPAALAAWLHGVAFRLALKARARKGRHASLGLPPDDEAPVDPNPDPLDRLTAREALGLLEEEVRRLPEVYRLPVILCCLEGKSQDEAAQVLGWSPGSVKGRLERGRARLHARLAGKGLTLAALELSQGAASVPLPRLVPAARAVALAAEIETPGRVKFAALLVVGLVVCPVVGWLALSRPVPPDGLAAVAPIPAPAKPPAAVTSRELLVRLPADVRPETVTLLAGIYGDGLGLGQESTKAGVHEYKVHLGAKAQRVKLLLHRPSYAVVTAEFDVKKGFPQPFVPQFKKLPTVPLKVRLVDAAGAPVAGERLAVGHTLGTMEFYGYMDGLVWGATAVEATTDANGEATIQLPSLLDDPYFASNKIELAGLSVSAARPRAGRPRRVSYQPSQIPLQRRYTETVVITTSGK